MYKFAKAQKSTLHNAMGSIGMLMSVYRIKPVSQHHLLDEFNLITRLMRGKNPHIYSNK